MSNGDCVYHRALQTAVNSLKESNKLEHSTLTKIDDAQWIEINSVKLCLKDCIKTKSLIAIAAIAAIVFIAVFGVVWAEVSATRDTAYRIEKQIIAIVPEIRNLGD